MAYLRDIPRPKCSCGRPARVELVNRVNAPIGCYCPSCGRRRLKALIAQETGPEVVPAGDQHMTTTNRPGYDGAEHE